MKKQLKYVAIFAIGLLSLSSCDDFFDAKSPSEEDPELVYNDVQSIESVITGIYKLFAENNSYRNRLCGGYVGNNTDIEYGNKTNGNAAYNNYTISTSNGDLAATANPWNYINSAITKANIIIKRVNPNAGPDFAYLYGEALTLRAFFYLELIKYWGDVPARFDDEADPNPSKADRNVIFEQLRKDLKQASGLVPWSNEIPLTSARNYVGRISKGYVLGLLAKVDLHYAGKGLRPDTWTGAPTQAFGVQYNVKDAAKRQELYKEALEACAQVINREDSKLLPSFEQVFKTICRGEVSYYNTESMFEVDFNDDSRGQVLNLTGLKSSNANNILLNRGTQSNNAMQYIVPTYVYDFEQGDKRKWVTVAPFNWDKVTVVANDAGSGMKEIVFPGSTAGEMVLYPKIQKINSFCLAKYRYEWMPAKVNSADDGLNIVLMRYSDILLMFAEATIGGISGDIPNNMTGLDGQVQFNKVRTRAGLASKPLTMDNIINERAFEFCGENIRKYDLMRWGKLGSTLGKTMERLADLCEHRYEFADTNNPGEIYVKYKQNNALLDPSAASQSPAVLKAYEIDEIYGLAHGETGSKDSAEGWYKTDVFTSDSGANQVLQFDDRAKNYWLYGNNGDYVNVDNRQLWPLFDIITSVNKKALWNDGWVNNDSPSVPH